MVMEIIKVRACHRLAGGRINQSVIGDGGNCRLIADLCRERRRPHTSLAEEKRRQPRQLGSFTGGGTEHLGVYIHILAILCRVIRPKLRGSDKHTQLIWIQTPDPNSSERGHTHKKDPNQTNRDLKSGPELPANGTCGISCHN